MWEGSKMLKEKRRVTFSYIPPYKDEDDENYRGKRSILSHIRELIRENSSSSINRNDVENISDYNS